MNIIAEARSRYRPSERELDPITAGAEDEDFSPEQAATAVKRFFNEVGAKRWAQLEALDAQNKGLFDRHAGDYGIKYAHTGYSSDFTDQASYEYLRKKYPWLHERGGSLSIDVDAATDTHGTFEDWLASIPHEDWESFITDMEGFADYPSLDDDRASELEMKECSRWLKEDGGPDLLKHMVEDCPDAYEGYLLNKATIEMVYDWSRETEHYPEAQGEGSVYMNMDNLAEKPDTQAWFLEKVIEVLGEDQAGWLAIKRAFYMENLNAFDDTVKGTAQTDEAIAHAYAQMDGESLWQVFQQAFPDEHRHDDDPYWYLWKAAYDMPGIWVAGYRAESSALTTPWQGGFKEALEYLSTAPWFLTLLRDWNRRGPEVHPELQFEALEDEPTAELGRLPSRYTYLKSLVDNGTATQAQAVEYAIIEAESVLFVFEKKYPTDDRPRKAIEAARTWWKNPTEENARRAGAADATAYATAYAAYATTAYAAYAATAYAAYTAAYADFLRWAKKAGEWAAKARGGPLKESLETDPDDASTFIKYNGGLSQEVLYTDAKIKVIYPKDLQTLNHYLRVAGFREIGNTTWIDTFNHRDRFVVVVKDEKQPGSSVGRVAAILREWVGEILVYTGTVNTPKLGALLSDPEYGANLRRMLLAYYRESVERDSDAAMILMQVGGVRELRRADRRGHISLEEYSLPIGLDYVQKHKYGMAAKALGRSVSTLTPKGVWLQFDGIQELLPVFSNADAASSVFNYDTDNWFDGYYDGRRNTDMAAAVAVLTPKAKEHIKEIMLNRRVWFPDGGEDGRGDYAVLTRKMLNEVDTETVMDWISNPQQEDMDTDVFEDIVDAVQLVVTDMFVTVSVDSVFLGFEKAAIDAIDGVEHKWMAGKKGNDVLSVFVKWPDVSGWSQKYVDEHGSVFNEGGLEELALNVNGERANPDVNTLEADWSDVEKMSEERRADYMGRILELEAPELPEDPKQVQLPLKESTEPDLDAPEASIRAMPSRYTYLKSLVDNGTATRSQAVEYAIIEAESVLFVFEKKYPTDDRPRKAIEAAKAWWRDPTAENARRAYAAATATAATATAAAHAAAYAAAVAAYAAAVAAFTDDFLYWAKEAGRWAAEARGGPLKESAEDDLDAPEAMPQALSGVPVQVEVAVRGAIEAVTKETGIKISDIRMEFDSASLGDARFDVFFAVDHWNDWDTWSRLIEKLATVVAWGYRRWHVGFFAYTQESGLHGQPFHARFVLHPAPTT